jgi:hypothetical protein
MTVRSGVLLLPGKNYRFKGFGRTLDGSCRRRPFFVGGDKDLEEVVLEKTQES